MNDKTVKALEAFKNGKFKQALSIVEKINKSKSKQTFATLEIQAASLASLNLNARAKECFLKVLELAPDDSKRAKLCYDLFATSSKLKEYKDAELYLKKAIELVPNAKSVMWRLSLANMYFQLRKYDLCEELSAKLLVYKPCTIICMNMLMDIAVAKTDIGKVDYYLRQFEGRMTELNGQQILSVYAKVEAYTTLDFSKSIAKAIARGADPYTVKVIQASTLFKAGKLDESFDILSSFTTEHLKDDPPKKRYNEILGQISDKRKDYPAAFKYFQDMNKIAWRQYEEKGGASNELQKYAAFDSFALSKRPYTAPIKMFFLVGFPRSGTTLLENILDSQERIIALPERPMLDDVKMKLILEGHDYPNCLQNISDDYLDELREHYFASVLKNSSHTSLAPFDILVDKNPINSIRIPFIKKLFPDAKIIMALRHPLDCILSCYMQNFGINPHLADFSDWERCFKRYKETFDLYEGFKKYLDWDEYQIKYENVVGDFENEVEKILAFMGVDVDKESYMNFNKRADKQVITTPSGSQVRQGIYQSASQRWEKYKDYIKPHIDLVQPHIDRLGYSAKM